MSLSCSFRFGQVQTEPLPIVFTSTHTRIKQAAQSRTTPLAYSNMLTVKTHNSFPLTTNAQLTIKPYTYRNNILIDNPPTSHSTYLHFFFPKKKNSYVAYKPSCMSKENNMCR